MQLYTKKAGRFALRENIEADRVSMKHFQKSLQKTGSSLTADIMKYYKTLVRGMRTKQSKEIEGHAYV